jgi:hypothetical protein
VYYVLYSLALFMATWRPVEFTPAWGIASHLFDVAAFSLFAAFADAGSQVLVYFVFAVLCATVRWRSIGAFWTAAGGIGILALASIYGGLILEVDGFGFERLRGAACIPGTASHRLLEAYGAVGGKLSRIALWPRMLPGDSRAIVTDIGRVEGFPGRDVGPDLDRSAREAEQSRVGVRRRARLGS